MGKSSLVRIREGVALGDLHFEGQVESVATYLVETRDGLAVVDPGPTSCADGFHEALRRFGAELGDVRHVLLTHIHLDHAGYTGALARAVPRATVYVHEVGAPHLVDPTRLLTSARRIYGTYMDRLWGEFLPVPADRLHVLAGDERLALGERRWRVAATPGHAIHHLAFLDEREGLAWTGDVAGEATQHGTPALPAAPPPDIDLEAWRTSLDLLEGWRAEQLLLTHFGSVADPAAHLSELWGRVVDWAEKVRVSLDEPGTDEERAAQFANAEWAFLTRDLPSAQAAWVHRATIESSWPGLARYWRKRTAASA
ncbi:MAG: MBL fold metallo-hydrolase [Gemmatimonadetes bacterium]|nr:MBL fold metallo-hydrolase [Gemmatimonadota bacterium]